MPCGATYPGARILEWLELQSFGTDSNRFAVTKEQILISRDKMGERATFPNVSVQP